jgi:hypothetical protein
MLMLARRREKGRTSSSCQDLSAVARLTQRMPQTALKGLRWTGGFASARLAGAPKLRPACNWEPRSTSEQGDALNLVERYLVAGTIVESRGTR